MVEIISTVKVSICRSNTVVSPLPSVSDLLLPLPFRTVQER